jgi:serine protease Do
MKAKFALLLAGTCAWLAAAGCGPTAGSAGGKWSGQAADFRSIIERAKSKVYPAIVFVKPIREEFSGGEKQKMEVFGSGAIISADGLMFTNAHVAEKAASIRVVLGDKEQYAAKLVGLDKETDLALLKIELPAGHAPLPTVEFGDSSAVEEGEFAMAMGSPFGFTRSISFGVISNTRRYIGFRTQYKYNLWLQTDAAINPGNSGGPLVDSEGRVIGINTLGAGGEGLGFAIPSNTAKQVLETLRTKGKVPRAWLGIELQALKDFNQNTFFEGDRGVLAAGVDDPSPAKDGGLQNGDLILAVNGKPLDAIYVEDLPAVRCRLAELPAKQVAELTVRRKGQESNIKVIPEDSSEFEGEDFECKRWNMTIKGISRYASPSQYYFRKQGVYVQGVRWPGNAQDAGIQAGDIVISVEDEKKNVVEITGVGQFREIYERLLADPKREKKVLLSIKRGAYVRPLILDYRREFKEETK